MTAHPELLYLCVLPHRQRLRLLVPEHTRIDNDGDILIFGSRVDLRAVASFLLVVAALVEELPIFFRQILNKTGNLGGTQTRVFFLEAEQHFQSIGLDEHLPHELILPGFPRDED